MSPDPPVVLCIGGHDPTGGAGIQADIETGVALGCHVATVIACLTVQDTRDVRELHPVAPALVAGQAGAVLDDLPVRAIKLGLLGSPAVIEAVARIIAAVPHIPVVADPVLAAGGGRDMSNATLITALRELVLPHTALLTPNSVEAQRLARQKDLATCAAELLATGCGALLITGGHEPGERLVSRLFRPGLPETAFDTLRVPGEFHGTGCTLAAAIAACLARGCHLEAAIRTAHAYTSAAVAGAVSLGRGQSLLRRRPVDAGIA